MAKIFYTIRRSLEKDIFERKLADQSTATQELTKKITKLKEEIGQINEKNAKFQAEHDAQMAKFEKLKKRCKEKAMDIWRRYQVENLTRITLYRRAFGNWKWLMPVIRDHNSADKLSFQTNRAEEAESTIRSMHQLNKELEKEKNELKVLLPQFEKTPESRWLCRSFSEDTRSHQEI